jgi:release factor glutamine methyltransferase
MSYERSLERSRDAQRRPDRPRTFTMAGRQWDLLDEVFAPPFSATTETAMEILGLIGDGPARLPTGGSFLEIGSGTGIIAVMAALEGAGHVVATDVNPSAVENTRLNATRHQVTDRLTALRSDLFSALPAGERFDRVYWHSNFVLAPESYRYQAEHERAYVDPGYRSHRRYLEEAPKWLTEGGAAYLQFCDRGNLDRLREIAAELGRELTVLHQRCFSDGSETLRHILLQITAPS